MSFGLFVKQLQISIGAVLNELEPFEVVEGHTVSSSLVRKTAPNLDWGRFLNELESYEDCINSTC